MVSEGTRAADIGCDHGYVPIALCRDKRCTCVIAMDIKKGPLERARKNIERFGLTDYIETRLSDGTDALEPGEADTLIIAGMGGRLTIRILTEGFAHFLKFDELVLQPQSEIFRVREFLRLQGISIIDEAMVFEDGKYYTIIKASCEPKRQTKDTDDRSRRTVLEDYFGPVLLKKRPAVFEKFLQKEAEKTKKLLTQVTKQERIRELQQYLSYVEEALEDIE